jgi:hypothetical protein
MANIKKAIPKAKTKADLELIKGANNLLIDKQKSYQRKVKGPQVENQTMLKEAKKQAATKPKAIK